MMGFLWPWGAAWGRWSCGASPNSGVRPSGGVCRRGVHGMQYGRGRRSSGTRPVCVFGLRVVVPQRKRDHLKKNKYNATIQIQIKACATWKAPTIGRDVLLHGW